MIFIDTETTGLLNPSLVSLINQPKIIEFYGVKFDKDWNKIGELDILLDPGEKLEPIITKITGLTDDDLKGKPQFISVYKDFCELFLGDDEVVGHNVEFDLGMILVELKRHGLEYKFPWPSIHTCTVEMSTHLTSKSELMNKLEKKINSKRLKLSQLHELVTGKAHADSHRAKGDVMALIRCYRMLKGIE